MVTSAVFFATYSAVKVAILLVTEFWTLLGWRNGY